MSPAASPDAPYRGKYAITRGATVFSTRSNAEQLGLVIPAPGGGWWKTVIVVLDDGSWRGYARKSAFGDLFPASTAETLLIRGRARPMPDGDGWRFDLTIDIPPAPLRLFLEPEGPSPEGHRPLAEPTRIPELAAS